MLVSLADVRSICKKPIGKVEPLVQTCFAEHSSTAASDLACHISERKGDIAIQEEATQKLASLLDEMVSQSDSRIAQATEHAP